MKQESAEDWTEQKEEAFQRFLEHFPLNADITLQLLKAHLLVEEVNTLLEMFVNNVEELRSASLTFYQKICLLKSLYPATLLSLHDCLNKAEKLNVIRNKIAHNLAPVGLEDKLVSFCELFKWKDEKAKSREEWLEDFLPTALARVHAGLVGYRLGLQHRDLRPFKELKD